MTVVFEGIDDWNRPVFKSIDSNIRLGSTWELFEYGATESDVREKIGPESLEYFGQSFNCEPNGGILKEPVEIEWRS